jgi:hypothetical protein
MVVGVAENHPDRCQAALAESGNTDHRTVVVTRTAGCDMMFLVRALRRTVNEADPLPGNLGPREMLGAAGVYLSTRYPDFTWIRSSNELRRVTGTRQDKIVLHGSRYNRAGGPTVINVSAVVFDLGLAKWRKANANECIMHTPFVSRVPSSHTLDLTDPAGRSAALSTASNWIAQQAMSLFDLIGAPARFAGPEGDPFTASHREATLEWLLWRGDVPLARAFVERACSNPPAGWFGHFERGRHEGAAGRKLALLGNGAEELGWLTARHALLA